MPPHDLGFQNVIADVISNHVIALVEKGAILQLTEALGNIGSEVIDQLVRSNMVREIEEKDYARSLHRIAQKMDGMRCCEFCRKRLNAKLENGEYSHGILRCGSCHMQV